MPGQEKPNVSQMIEDLNKQSEELKIELMELEKNFNLKKEQFIKIQGALEAFSIMKEN
jgi:hypothetical protein